MLTRTLEQPNPALGRNVHLYNDDGRIPLEVGKINSMYRQKKRKKRKKILSASMLIIQKNQAWLYDAQTDISQTATSTTCVLDSWCLRRQRSGGLYFAWMMIRGMELRVVRSRGNFSHAHLTSHHMRARPLGPLGANKWSPAIQIGTGELFQSAAVMTLTREASLPSFFQLCCDLRFLFCAGTVKGEKCIFSDLVHRGSAVQWRRAFSGTNHYFWWHWDIYVDQPEQVGNWDTC